MKHLKRFNESNQLNFDDVVDMEKLQNIALGIKSICLGEYGLTFINKNEMKIGVSLGDANPFGDLEELEDWIRWECVKGDHDFIKSFDIEVDCEWDPTRNGGWLTFDGKKFK